MKGSWRGVIEEKLRRKRVEEVKGEQDGLNGRGDGFDNKPGAAATGSLPARGDGDRSTRDAVLWAPPASGARCERKKRARELRAEGCQCCRA